MAVFMGFLLRSGPMVPAPVQLGADNAASSPTPMPADLLTPALHGSLHHTPRATAVRTSVVVVGAGGTLGSAVLAEALVAGRFQRVMALVAAPLTSTLPGLLPLPLAELARLSGPTLGADTALLIFERARHSNGRDDAFVMPDPAELPALSRLLHGVGVRRLLVVVPHSPALLPHALRHGLASLDEGAVAALGFEHLVFVRSAQAGVRDLAGSRVQRFADWWLSQLAWMVPTREQPVRAVKLAALVVQIAQRLPQSRPGTRIAPQELLWQAAQDGADTHLDDWLARP
jgi:hypothetical protein